MSQLSDIDRENRELAPHPVNLPPRQAVAFPEVASIRKGTPKRIEMRDGRRVETLGKDLNDKFRIQFLRGAADAQAAWMALYPENHVTYGAGYVTPEGFQHERLRAVFPFSSASMCWSWFNEAYSSGMRIAQADDNHYLSKRDPLTGEYTVRYGEPFTEFRAKDVITYTRNNKSFQIPLRSVGRLRLFFPELQRLVNFVLKTTSIYDRWQIESQLGGIQAIANSLNHGNVAGIPFTLYRMKQPVVWNKPGEGAVRLESWLINLEIDTEWVKAACVRMTKMAGGELPDADELVARVKPLPASVLMSDHNPDADVPPDEDSPAVIDIEPVPGADEDDGNSFDLPLND